MRRITITGIGLLSAVVVGVALARLPREEGSSGHERTVFAQDHASLNEAEDAWLNGLLNQLEDVYVGENVYLEAAGITADQCIINATEAMQDSARPAEARAYICACCSALVLDGAATTPEQESRILETWLSIMMSPEEEPRMLMACRAAVRENNLESHPAFAEAVARVNADPDYRQWLEEARGHSTPLYPD